MQNFIAQSMRRAGLAPANKGPVSSQSPTNKMNQTGTAPDSEIRAQSDPSIPFVLLPLYEHIWTFNNLPLLLGVKRFSM